MGTSVVRRSGAGRRTRRSAQEWRALLEACARSGETRRAFCARHGIALSTFDWWQRRVQAESRANAPAPRGAADANALFVELAAPLPVSSKAVVPAWDLELDLGAGVVLRLRRSAVSC